MANRKRNIQIKFYVTEEEKRLIDQKMVQLPTQRYGAYLRKMAIDGYIIYTDTADIKAFTKELSAIGRNINQIAKRINAGGPAYQDDMDEIWRWAAWEKKPCCAFSLTVRTSRPFFSALTATKPEATLAAALRSLCRRA